MTVEVRTGQRNKQVPFTQRSGIGTDAAERTIASGPLTMSATADSCKPFKTVLRA